MFCMQCGKQVDPINQFCPYCGSRLDHPAIENARQAAQAAQPVGSARQALPTYDEQAEEPVQVRPLVSRPQGQQDGRRSQVREGLSARASTVQAAPVMPRPPASSNRGGMSQGNMALLVALGAVALIAVVALAILRPFPGFSPAAPATSPASEQPAQDDGQATDATTPSDGQPAQQDGSAGVAVRPGLADYSWEELDQIAELIETCGTRAEALAIAQEYNLVDASGRYPSATKDVTMSDGQVLHFRLVGVWHDEAMTTSGKAGLTFLATNVAYRHRMASGKTTPGGWEGSELRSWMNSDLLALFPEEVSSAIEPAYKFSNNDGKTTSADCVTSTADRLWAPSIVELCGPVSWTFDSDPKNSGYYNAVFNAEGEQYAAFTQASIVSDEDNAALSYGGEWWLRSTAASTGRGRRVSASGNPSSFGDSSDDVGVILGFCL